MSDVGACLSGWCWSSGGRRCWPALLLGLLLALAPPVRAEVTFERSALTIESGSGPLAFEVELAVTPEQRQRGLMFRESLDSDQGMLFDFGRSGPVTMWMRNTLISLDMLFIEADGRIARIVADTEPLSDAVISSHGPVLAVLELRGGSSAELGIAVGDQVIHPIFAKP
ncbi:MAG TPA: DUF192 domain-containing protein [Geminicoccaceae bacterium]|nr:DUF192 domain-containing protein [Geminicoccaceae bacterium]